MFRWSDEGRWKIRGISAFTVREFLVDKVYVERGLADWNVISISISRQSRDGYRPRRMKENNCRKLDNGEGVEEEYCLPWTKRRGQKGKRDNSGRKDEVTQAAQLGFNHIASLLQPLFVRNWLSFTCIRFKKQMVTIKHEIAIKLLFVYVHAHGLVNFCAFFMM